MSMPTRHQDDADPRAEKMSAKVLRISDGFIEAGDTVQERQNRLMAVCTAWNLACGNPENLQQQLASWASTYAHFNPDSVAEDVAAKAKFIANLIERKRNMYPHENRQILDARIVPIGDSFRVEVACARLSG